MLHMWQKIKLGFVIPGIAAFFVSCGTNSAGITPVQQAASEEALETNGAVISQRLSVNLNRWMGDFPESTRLSALTIPGTHDSGATRETVSGTAKTQNTTILQQLMSGTRFFDIRCRHVKNKFYIYHGSIDQKLTFQQVYDTIRKWLYENPSETVIISVKEEHTPSGNSRSFRATMDSYIDQTPSKWSLTKHVRTLGEVRGKIVLLNRYDGDYGIIAHPWRWVENGASFIIDDGSSLNVQDQFKVSNDNLDGKWSAIEAQLDRAKNETNMDKMYVNFASGRTTNLFGIPNIPKVSNHINPKLSEYFDRSTTKGRYGIIVMDFMNSNLNNKIINSNYK